MEEKTKTDQDETGGVAVSRNNVASKKTEIGNAERTAKMLKDEIKSLDGGQRTAIILETNLKQGEVKLRASGHDTRAARGHYRG